MNYEIVKPDWISEDAILISNEFKRFIVNGIRYYLLYKNENDRALRTGVTSVLDVIIPKDLHLIKWIGDVGNERAEEIKNEKADYGTIMHELFKHYLIYKELDFNTIIEHYCKECKINYNTIEKYTLSLKKDCLSFIQFVKEKNVTPIAVEYQVYNKHFAGTIDLICKMDFNRSRVVAIIDYKSGKKKFYDSYKVQLHAYKQLLADNDFNVDMVFNFAPKDWQFKSGASYSLENQSDEKWSKMWDLYSALYLVQQDKKEVVNYNIADVINETNLENCITNEIFEVA